MGPRAGAIGAAVLAAAVAGACAAGAGRRDAAADRDTGPAASPLPTSQSSISPQVAATVVALRRELEAAGYRLDLLAEPYRPSEPPALATVPRTIFHVGLPEPEDGYVVVYEFRDAATAAATGREFATYLGSGFGQTNYPLDAQFSLAQLGGTLVFTWWSRERSSDPERAGAVFEAVSRVGQRIEIRK